MFKKKSQYKNILSVAPMMNCTDRHCRTFHRLITKYTLLYSEMISSDALINGNLSRLLDFSDEERPVALQLGGSEPNNLAKCSKFAENWGYNEVNLNCGCPSERVQKGAFGASLMENPNLVADCIKAMKDSVSLEVTIKHRIGINNTNSYDFLRDFVGIVSNAGCRTFIVHARNAILSGLTPKQNREIPPLKYDYVYQLKKDFPSINIIINGGIKTLKQIEFHLNFVDGVMIGREAYSNPYLMSVFDSKFYNDKNTPKTRPKIIEEMSSYILSQMQLEKVSINSITRHMYGLMSGVPGAKKFRQLLTGNSFLKKSDVSTLINMLYQITNDVV